MRGRTSAMGAGAAPARLHPVLVRSTPCIRNTTHTHACSRSRARGRRASRATPSAGCGMHRPAQGRRLRSEMPSTTAHSSVSVPFKARRWAGRETVGSGVRETGGGRGREGMRSRGGVLAGLERLTSSCFKCRRPSSPSHEELLGQVVEEEHAEDGDNGRILE